jgi:hypothetical protein
MRLMSLVVLAAVAVALAAVPAEAAKRKRSQVVAGQSVRNEAGVVVRRSRTRIIVTKRSYLDAGTEVYPGSQNYTDYVFSPNYGSPAYSVLGPGRRDGEPNPALTPFWINSYHTPNWGY